MLLFVGRGFFYGPGEVETTSKPALDEKSLKPTKIEPVEVGDRNTAAITYTLDASSTEKWIYFDFSRGSVVDVPNKNSLEWDIAFRRAKILTNSGATNPKGGGGAIAFNSVKFDEINWEPEGKKFEIDYRPYNKAENENKALYKWYKYNYINHRLEPKPMVFIIRTADGRFARARILTYYCEGEKAGCYTMQYNYWGSNS